MPSKSTRRNPLLIPLLVVFLVALIAVVMLIVNIVRHGNQTSQLQQQMIGLTDDLMEYQLDKTMMDDQLSKIELVLQTLQDENAPEEPAEHVKAIVSELSYLRLQMAGLPDALAENSALMEEKMLLEADVAMLTSFNAEFTEENAALAAEVEALTAKVAGLEGNVAELTAANAELTAANEALAAESAKAAENSALTEENAALTAKNAELSTALDALTTELGSLTGMLDAAQNALHAAIAEASESQTLLLTMLGRTASADGFSGPVSVTAVVTEQGEIVCLTIDASGETANLGQQVMDPRFMSQFKGKTLPLVLGEGVDAVSGATVTSQAVVDALNLLTPEYATPHDNIPALPDGE